jgi:hypothetical protein
MHGEGKRGNRHVKTVTQPPFIQRMMGSQLTRQRATQFLEFDVLTPASRASKIEGVDRNFEIPEVLALFQCEHVRLFLDKTSCRVFIWSLW